MSNYPDLDAEEKMTFEQRAQASADRIAEILSEAGCPFTPEEKASCTAERLRDAMMNMKLETDRLEAAEKAAKSAAYQKAKARKEARVAEMSPEAREYYLALQKVHRLLRTPPPEGPLPEKIKATVRLLTDRLGFAKEQFEAAYPKPIEAEFVVIEEEKA